jgi:dihydrofolate synthase/folylpolyglutamate synthase
MLLAQVLSAAGYKTGLFVSPHLISPTERIQIDGTEILPEDFVRTVEKVLAQEREPLNLFEVLTAAAWVYFADKHVQYAVLETGMGGRKDPTNVCLPVLSVITSIGLDHTQVLGNTLREIATEKAGIIKPGVPVLCGALPPDARHVVEQAAQANNAPLKIVCSLLPAGNAHVQNTHLVWHVANALGIADSVLVNRIEKAQLPGRFEIFHRGNKTFILDGAHNPPALENLLALWQTTPFSKRSAAVLCGFMQDKDYPQMLTRLAAYFSQGTVTVPPSSRAAGACHIGPLLSAGWTFMPDVSAALAHVQQEADVILCTGSFYLVGAVRAQLLKLP